MTVDLYAVLGVRRNASAASIKRAYREAVKKHHPDVGGDRELFESAQKAFEVLSDPERREKYDRTGAYDDAPVNDPRMNTVIQMVGTAIDLVFQECDQRGEKFWRVDLVRRAITKLQEKQKLGASQSKPLAEHIEKLKEIRGRFERKHAADGPSMSEIIGGKISTLELQLGKITTELDMVAQAIALIASHNFRYEGDGDIAQGAMRTVFIRMDPSSFAGPAKKLGP